MFADDSKFTVDSGLKSQEDIVEIEDWCNKWSICLSGGKFKVMHLVRDKS